MVILLNHTLPTGGNDSVKLIWPFYLIMGFARLTLLIAMLTPYFSLFKGVALKKMPEDLTDLIFTLPRYT